MHDACALSAACSLREARRPPRTRAVLAPHAPCAVHRPRTAPATPHACEPPLRCARIGRKCSTRRRPFDVAVIGARVETCSCALEEHPDPHPHVHNARLCRRPAGMCSRSGAASMPFLLPTTCRSVAYRSHVTPLPRHSRTGPGPARLPLPICAAPILRRSRSRSCAARPPR